VSSGRQKHFESQLRKIAWHLGSDTVPVFLDFNGEKRRADKGCLGHAVANSVLLPVQNSAEGYVTHVQLKVVSGNPVGPAPDDKAKEALHLQKIESADARQAYHFLRKFGAEVGMTTNFKIGQVPAVEWRDSRGRYLFAFIPNAGHLLFYLRLPALRIDAALGSAADTLGLPTNANSAGEITVRLETQADAERLTAWLASFLPKLLQS